MIRKLIPIALAAILAVEVYHLIGLALITELFYFVGCHLMAVDGSPDRELTLYFFIAVVTTVISSCAYSYLTTTLRTLADGGVQHDLSLYRGRK